MILPMAEYLPSPSSLVSKLILGSISKEDVCVYCLKMTALSSEAFSTRNILKKECLGVCLGKNI